MNIPETVKSAVVDNDYQGISNLLEFFDTINLATPEGRQAYEEIWRNINARLDERYERGRQDQSH